MGTSDFSQLQKDFMKNVSDWTARVTSVLNENLTRMGASTLFNVYRDSPAGRIGPMTYWKMMDPNTVTERLRELIQFSLQDLPELLKNAGDPAAVDRMANKWSKSYETTLREILGLPAASHSERLLDFWKACASTVEGLQSGFDPFGPMRAFVQPRGSSFAPESLGAYGEWMKAWSETYEKAFETMFRAPRTSNASGYGEKAKLAFDAQIEFVKSLQTYHEQLLDAAGNAMKRVARHVNDLGTTQVTTEVQEHFHKIWLSFIEDSLTDLYQSETFEKSVSDMMELGMDARKKMEEFVAEVRSFLDVPSRKETEGAVRAVKSMDERVRQLEKEVRILREKTASLNS